MKVSHIITGLGGGGAEMMLLKLLPSSYLTVWVLLACQVKGQVFKPGRLMKAFQYPERDCLLMFCRGRND